ncbi:MAG: MarR family transcriptional regulator [Rhizobiaceae bacterium]|nr:MarR family transcriptional regulator [Rhizobiaceae bacterium]
MRATITKTPLAEKPKLSLKDERICFALYSSSKAVTGLYQPYLKKMKLTYLQYVVVIVLLEHGQMSVGDLGKELYLDSGTLTPVLKRMEGLGLLSRQRSSQDERKVCIELTDKARLLRDEIAEMQFKVSCVVGLKNPKIKELKSQLSELNERLRSS